MGARRKRFLAAVVVGVLGLLGTAVPAGAAKPTVNKLVAAPAGTRAMWLWSAADSDTVANWAVAHGVKEIFAYVAPGAIPSADLQRLARLRTRADAAGIRLAALGAETTWVANPAAAVAWQRTVLGTGLFALAHVDVEPYLLPGWTSDRAGTVAAYLRLLDALQQGDSRPLEADVPFWYSTIPVGTSNLANQVLARVSAVTVMSYRDTATGTNSIMGVATDMLVRGRTAGKPVRLAVETQPLADCVYCTFYQEGQQRMVTTLAAVDTSARAYSSFAGIAIHHYDSWLVLAP